MTRRTRLLVPVFLALLALAATAPGVFALSARYPSESLGARGSNVEAIQATLISRDYPIPFDGVFGVETRDAVRDFQLHHGLPVTGIVNGATWDRLLTRVGPGSVGMPVRVLQRELDAKRHSGLAIDGIYGSRTRAAVIAFQKHMGLGQTGVVTLQTWRWLIWHYETPVFNATTLCDYSVGNGPANWATSDAIGQLEAAAAVVAGEGHGRVAVGDASFEHGGNIPGHVTHEKGLDVDVRLMRDDRNQCRAATTYRRATYDRAATLALIRAIRATAPGHVKLIYFNDPVLIRQGLVQAYPGHDDHLHIRYCEPGYPDPMYRC